MSSPITLPNIRNITISGRIGSGQTTLATKLAAILSWKLLEGGDLFERFHKEMNDPEELAVSKRPDDIDLAYEEHVKELLRKEHQRIIQSHLAGFDAQGIPGVFKILVSCEDVRGSDKPEIRIDRLVNRKGISIEQAKKEVLEREDGNLAKWRRLYARGNPNWVYWDKKYYDLVINTYSHNQEETLKIALSAIGYKR